MLEVDQWKIILNLRNKKNVSYQQIHLGLHLLTLKS